MACALMTARSISVGTRGTRETRKQAAGRLAGVMPVFSTLTTHPQRLLPVAALPFLGEGGRGRGEEGGCQQPAHYVKGWWGLFLVCTHVRLQRDACPSWDAGIVRVLSSSVKTKTLENWWGFLYKKTSAFLHAPAVLELPAL